MCIRDRLGIEISACTIANSDGKPNEDAFALVVDEKCLWIACLLYTSPSPRDRTRSRMPSSACKKKKTKHICRLRT